jgi:flagellar hook-basal body complex protein FliE
VGIETFDLPGKTGSGGGAGAFQSALSDAINQVQSTQQSAQTTIDRFLSGENEEVHQVALATQKAELQFEMFMQVRNKVVAAYQEVMKMQM